MSIGSVFQYCVPFAWNISSILPSFQETPHLFRRYVSGNSVIFIGGLIATAIFIIISGTKQSASTERCYQTYFQSAASSVTGEVSQTDILCKVFVYLGIGMMSLLWILFALVQFYFLYLQRRYAQMQEASHDKYWKVGHAASMDEFGQDQIPLENQQRQSTFDPNESFAYNSAHQGEPQKPADMFSPNVNEYHEPFAPSPYGSNNNIHAYNQYNR